MVKKSILLMSLFAIGLTLGSSAKAGKDEHEVSGPMDKFVKRTPSKRPASSIQEPHFPSAKKPSQSKEGCSASARRHKTHVVFYPLPAAYVEDRSDSGSEDDLSHLSPADRAYVLKTESAS